MKEWITEEAKPMEWNIAESREKKEEVKEEEEGWIAEKKALERKIIKISAITMEIQRYRMKKEEKGAEDMSEMENRHS